MVICSEPTTTEVTSLVWTTEDLGESGGWVAADAAGIFMGYNANRIYQQEEVTTIVTTPGTCVTTWPCGFPDIVIPRIDPIAQTFFIDNQPHGCYITELDVFFRTKSSTSSITLEIREVVNGYPGNKVLPFGRVTKTAASVNVDFTSASSATTFTFPSPVYLQNNTEYCFVLLPTGNDPNYTIWVSELGELDVVTNTRISEQPAVGVLFTSSNNRTWTAYQAEDIKFNLKRAFFTTTETAQLTLENENFDYLNFSSFTGGSNFVAGQAVHGVSFAITTAGSGYGSALAATVAVSGTAGQFTCGASKLVVGDLVTITGTKGGTATITGYATGTIYKVSAVTGSVGAVTGFTLTTQSGAAIVTSAGTLTGLTYTVATVVQHTLSGGGATTNATVNVTITGGVVTNVAVTNPGAGYTSNPTLTVSSGSGSGAVVAATLNRGFVKQYDSLYNVAKVFVQSGKFTVNTIIGNGTSYSNIDVIENKRFSTVKTNIGMLTHNPCKVEWILGVTGTGSTAPRDKVTGLDFDRNRNLPEEVSVFSYSNEQAFTGTDKKSTKLTAVMSTNSDTVSPVIDLKRLSIITVLNDVNNDSSTETLNNGSASSRYISRRVNLDEGQDAEDLKVYLTNNLPSGTDAEVYAKLLSDSDSRNFDDVSWVLLDSLTSPTAEQRNIFSDYEYQLPAASYFTVATGDVNTSTDTITETAHGLAAGDAVVYGNDGGTSIAGLTNNTIYYVIASGLTANAFKVSATSGGSAIDLTGTGNSNQYFVTTDGTHPDGVYRYVVDNTTLYATYKTFAVKIVLLSDNTSLVPLVKELRAIALQV